ncbi:MAG: hypothetical protein DMG53_13155 [Acidobacteria bacterium]|nr:MAG: hypothetical protein DMG53_13155 [Acidobacteriota bacterium]
MKYSTLPRIKALLALIFTGRIPDMLKLLLGMFLICPILCAQQTNTPPDMNQQTAQMLLQRMDQLEATVRELRAALAQATAAIPRPAPAEAAPPSQREPEPQVERAPSEGMDLNKTLLRIRGFSDVTLHGSNLKGDTSSFSLGQVDLFVTSDVSEKLKFLSEIVFEAGRDNLFGVDVERLLLTYSFGDFLNVGVGRFHSAIGYYNTAYHHSTWLQTTTGRPFLFQFEDQGGILPIHNVGATASGRIPSGALGLHYVAEVGNGRSSRSPLNEPVQNVLDENNRKSVNFAVFARPDAVRGLQAGFSIYRDLLAPQNSPRVGETILAAHAVYVGLSFEWLNETLLLRHAPQGTSRVFNTPGFYTQVSRRFGSYRPYVRYQYVNASQSEPVFPDVGLRHGPSVGLRYDLSEFVALKLQYDYTARGRDQAIHALALQAGFTF